MFQNDFKNPNISADFLQAVFIILGCVNNTDHASCLPLQFTHDLAI
jgi:hypothetical protein